MGEATTTRSMSVLTFAREVDGEFSDPAYNLGKWVVFERPGEGRATREFHLGHEEWTAMGSPKELTIAIYPGDRQDLMEAEDFPA
jgi:hypothetical protein